MAIKSCIKRTLTLATLIYGCGVTSVNAQIAQQISPQNAGKLVQGGNDATGGIGDWSLSNGTLCAIISDVDHESEFSTKGGVLIDLGFCGRPDDAYTFSQDLIDGKRTRPLDTQTIYAENTNNSASITVQSKHHGLSQTTRYQLNSDNLTQLKISKILTRHDNEDESDFNFLSSVYFNISSLAPFIFASNNLNKNTGFTLHEFVDTGIKALPDAAHQADTIITISPPDALKPIAYGWQINSVTRLDGEKTTPLPWFALADRKSNAFIFLNDTLYLGNGSKLGWLQLPQIPLLELDKGSQIKIEQTVYIGNKADVASITDQIFKNTVHLSGTTSEPNSAIHVETISGTPVTHIRPDHDGHFQALLPKGKYHLTQISSAGRSVKTEIELNQKIDDLNLSLPKVSTLELPQGEAMRLLFEGINGTESPNFIDSFTNSIEIKNGNRIKEASDAQIFLSGSPSDKKHVSLLPGDYRIYATRGPEYSLEKTEITIAKNETKKLIIAVPKHIVKTPNHIASDLHVHSGLSFDNSFSTSERVRTFVAEHGEVMVASEHDLPVDFNPYIQELGVQEKITAIAAAEITSLIPTSKLPFTAGHINVFPYKPHTHAFRRGMINHENKRLREIIHDVKELEPNAIIQLNHPRTNLDFSTNKLPSDYKKHIDSGHYLDHLGIASHPYNPEKSLETTPNNVLIDKDPVTGQRDIDFDLIEVINPGGPEHEVRLQAVRKDWLSFLKQGEKIVATANSDSHGSLNQVAVPRTMVAMSDDTISTFDQNNFLNSLKSGNAYGTTGPMIELALNGVQMGETLKAAQADLWVQINSAHWINVDMVKIQINGETIAEKKLDSTTVKHESNMSKSYELNVPLSFAKDSFVTIEVIGNAGEDYKKIYPEISPYAFSNAIYVDHNNDGQWQPPGL